MNGSELATVLAALRYWQADLDQWEYLRSAVPPFHDMHFENSPPLTSEEVDDLCERLNSEGPVTHHW